MSVRERSEKRGIIGQGVFGDNLRWILDCDGKLIISGTGAMQVCDFQSERNLKNIVPWREYVNSIQKVVIEDGVSYIGDGAFQGCISLSRVVVPRSVTSIGRDAFHECCGLTSLQIKGNISEIGDRMCCACNLTDFKIPEGVTRIGEGAFLNCRNLATITIPKSVTKIESQAFEGCGRLESVFYTGSEEDWQLNINIGEENNSLKRAVVHHISRCNPDGRGQCYCRTLNSVISFNPSFCKNCPLLLHDKEFHAYVYCNFSLADYHNLIDDWDASTATKKKKCTDYMIEQKYTDIFPDFREIDFHPIFRPFTTMGPDRLRDFDSVKRQIFREKNWSDSDLRQIEEAYKYAAIAHYGMFRKGTKLPYLTHPMEAACIAASLSDDVDVFIAALLHDVAEDTKYTLDDIREKFGDEIAELVQAETEDKMRDVSPVASWESRKRKFLDDLSHAGRKEKIITLSDKLSNIRSLAKDYDKLGTQLWERFNQKNVQKQEWYYRSIAEELQEFEGTDALREYNMLLLRVFGDKSGHA